MKVRELIAELQKLDPEATVRRKNVDYGSDDRYESTEGVDIEQVMPIGNYIDSKAVVIA